MLRRLNAGIPAIRQLQRVTYFSSLPPPPPGLGKLNFVLPPFQPEFDFERDYENERKNLKLVPPPNFNFARDVMERWAAYDKHYGLNRLALWWCDDLGNERKFTYSEIVAQSKKLANALTMVAGLKQGDRVVIVLPKLYEWFIFALACCRAGITMCPGTGMLSERDLQRRIELSRAKCVITDDERVSRMDAAIDAIGQKCRVKSKIVVSPTPDPASRPGWLSYDRDLMESGVPSEHQCVVNKADDEMFIYFTSGTTGLPKMVDLPHYIALGHYTSSRYLLDVRPGDLVWSYCDPGWVLMLYMQYFGPWLGFGTTFTWNHTDPVANAADILDIMKKYPITAFVTAPTLYRMFFLENLPKPEEIPHLRTCLSGGEPTNPEIIEKWHRATGLHIREGFGQTETCLIACNFPGMPYRPGSMGKAVPSLDVVAVDNHFKEVEPGKEGHMAIRLPKEGNKRLTGLFKGYIDAPLETAKAFPKGTNLYITGDKVAIDKDGYIHFVGRSDDVIIMSGYRIGPFEVESALMEHPAVAESAAVSSPDKMRGEVVKAFVVLKPPYNSEDVDKQKLVKELQSHCKKVTAPYKYPRKIEFIDALPKTVSGKTRRIELREREWAAHPQHY